jgi:hypothetical protein
MAKGKEPKILTFRCPPELEGRLPPPTPAAAGLPEWLRAMPAQAFSAVVAAEDDTVKRCPPFVDAMTCGFLMPLVCDVAVEAGEFTWESDLPAGRLGAPRSPLGFHDASQVAGTPLFDADRSVLKFHNLWTIEAPPGWSLLFTHPTNRFDLPFTTLTGLVDCDRYHDALIHFPALWRDPAFSGVLPRGTPIAQCIPLKRERWKVRTAAFTDADARKLEDVMGAIAREKGVYRRRFRA